MLDMFSSDSRNGKMHVGYGSGCRIINRQWIGMSPDEGARCTTVVRVVGTEAHRERATGFSRGCSPVSV